MSPRSLYRASVPVWLAGAAGVLFELPWLMVAAGLLLAPFGLAVLLDARGLATAAVGRGRPLGAVTLAVAVAWVALGLAQAL